MKKYRSNAIKKPTDISIDASINTLVEAYPNGVRHSYYNAKVARLSSEAIRKLLDTTNNNIEDFKKLLAHNEAFNELIALKSDKLINNWYKNLLQAKTERTKKAAQIERNKLAKEARQVAKLKQRDRVREARRIQAIKDREARAVARKKAQAKAKNKALLWKELALSAQQKLILRRIAS